MNNIWLKRFGAATGAIYILIGLLRGGGDDGPGFHASRQQIVTWIHTNSTITSGRYITAFVELWVLVTSIVLIRRAGEPTAAVATPAVREPALAR